ncbi:MAG TPA: hypothetical protein VF985_02370 [Mariniflexile sp.]
MRTLLLIPFFALLLFTSCQSEKIEITPPNQEEALVANSELTSMISATSKMDGSADNIIDRASCLSVVLPVTVKANGIEIIVDSKEDYKTIEAIFNKFEDDDDKLEIIFPITVTLANHDEVVIENRDALENLIKECKGENEEDDDIECIDFQYPISFSVYNADFQIINVVTIESDRQLYRFIKRVMNAEVFASLNFPVTMVLADGTTVAVHNNAELAATIKEAKNTCNEDDNNDYHDDDFTKERLDNLLKTCPWVVYEVNRNQNSLTDTYLEYVMVFKEDGVVKVRKRGGDILTGSWSTRVTDHGVAIKLEFDTLVDFSLEWFVYEIEYGRIKLYTEGGNKIILKKNCDVVVDITKERIENYLQECFWRIARLSVNGIDNEKDYIGTPLKFLSNNEVKIRINGEFVMGTYEIGVRNAGFILKINLEGRPNLKLEWFITFLEPGLIKLENADNKMVLERHCFRADSDVNYIEDVLVVGTWKVAKYDDGLVHAQDPTENFAGYTINFLDTGRIKVTDPNAGITAGSWLAYRNNGLFLGLLFANEAPFNELTYRWQIKEVSPNRIELKDLNSTGDIERLLILEKKN